MEPEGWRPKISRFVFHLSPKFSLPLLSGVFSWDCGRGSRQWPTQNARLGFSGVSSGGGTSPSTVVRDVHDGFTSEDVAVVVDADGVAAATALPAGHKTTDATIHFGQTDVLSARMLCNELKHNREEQARPRADETAHCNPEEEAWLATVDFEPAVHRNHRLSSHTMTFTSFLMTAPSHLRICVTQAGHVHKTQSARFLVGSLLRQSLGFSLTYVQGVHHAARTCSTPIDGLGPLTILCTDEMHVKFRSTASRARRFPAC